MKNMHVYLKCYEFMKDLILFLKQTMMVSINNSIGLFSQFITLFSQIWKNV